MRKKSQILCISAAILAVAIIGGLVSAGYFLTNKTTDTDKPTFIIGGSDESFETKLTLRGRVSPDSTLYDLIVMGPPGCHPARINLDKPTEFVTYRNLNAGLKFEVPYNQQWGAPYFIYQPYDEELEHYPRTITFGKPVIDTCNGISSREYRLEFGPTETKEDLIARLEKVYAGSDDLKINTLNVDDKTVVRVSTYTGPGGYTAAIVMSKRYNYILTGGIPYDAPLIGVPLEIIKSMKLD